jgi:putative oxidoreductase
MDATRWIELIARIALVLMFPFSALEKIWHWDNAMAQTRSAHLPGAAPMLAAAILVEGLTPVFIVCGIWDRPAAALLAGFCVVTAFLYHPFWAYPDIFSPKDDSQGRAHFWEFVKNFGLVGGLILVVFARTLIAPESAYSPGVWSSRFLAESREARTPAGQMRDAVTGNQN